MDIAQRIAAWFLIPRGQYCHGRKDEVCPFWCRDSLMPAREDGYCHYLGQGDQDINEDKKWTQHTQQPDGSWLVSEPKSSHELGEKLSLLWDQVKECGIKC